MDRAEWEEKEGRLRALMGRHDLDAMLLSRSANVAWLSGGGRSFVNIAGDGGVGSLLVTPDARYLLTDVIEAQRLRDEEGFGEGGWEIVAEPWHDQRPRLAELTEGLRVGTDVAGTGFADLGGEIARLRWLLTPAEVERFRSLGAGAGAAIGEAAASARPGMSEYDIAGLLANATYKRGAVPIVTLVAVDERMMQRRHPLPTGKVLERTAMLVLCARRHGLVASVTRLVHFGRLPGDLRDKMRAVATVDAAAIAATQPGVAANTIFGVIQQAYADVGYPDEWKNHHQGGPAGYEPRDYVATPYTEQAVEGVQAFAWNPSVPGAKSEDTFLVTGSGQELLTPSAGWPQQQVEAAGHAMSRPDILQL
ncbi:MAG TPA: M24 family metallopeptidase [Chloroflexia bacterium]|nr:M24 family metallopeptidase [Chloroflexia bacterium]